MSIRTPPPPECRAACSLSSGALAQRHAEWASLRAARTAEHECCPFFGFELTFRDDTVTLVTAFPEGLSPASWEW